MTKDEERGARFALEILRTPISIPTSVLDKAQIDVAKALGVNLDNGMERVEKLISDAYYSGQNSVLVNDVLQALRPGAMFTGRPTTAP